MLFATGFLRKIFEIFESYQTPIDMITTSEVGVSMSIDNCTHLNEIVDELKNMARLPLTQTCALYALSEIWSGAILVLRH